MLEFHPCLRKDQMLSATAVELQALPIQPLDGNNSPLLCTVTDSFIRSVLCLILCTVLSSFLFFSPLVPIQIDLFMDSPCRCACVFFLEGSSVKPATLETPLPKGVLEQDGETPYRILFYIRELTQ